MSNAAMGRQRVVVLAVLIASACAAGEAAPPWDTTAMVREVTDDLRRYGSVASEPREIEVLAWKHSVAVQERATPPGLPTLTRRWEGASVLLWGRFERPDGSAEWLLVQVFKADDDTWRRASISTEFRSPPRTLRPGESPDGEWPGFARYKTPPSSQEICEFARVSYLAVHPPAPVTPGVRLLTRAGGVRVNTWRRVTGEDPRCGGWER